jgi:hypothetical protein
VTFKKENDRWIDGYGRELSAPDLQQRCEYIATLVDRAWTTLNGYEEKTAALISASVLKLKDKQKASQLQALSLMVAAVGVVMGAVQNAHQRRLQEGKARECATILKSPRGNTDVVPALVWSREAKLLYQKCVALMQMTAEFNDPDYIQRNGDLVTTTQMLSLIKALAHYVKLMVRIGFRGSLETLDSFLMDMSENRIVTDQQRGRYFMPILMIAKDNDTWYTCRKAIEEACFVTCYTCRKAVEEACFVTGYGDVTYGLPGRIWHLECFKCHICGQQDAADRFTKIPQTVRCSSCNVPWDVTYVPRLKQFSNLLWFALARLIVTMRVDFAILSDANIEDFVTEEAL